MSAATDKRTIAIVTACMKADGTPTFVRNDVQATQDEIENGAHYWLVEGQLLEDNFDEPFVHFDEHEAPAFLFPAVEGALAVASADNNLTLVEKS